MALKIRTSWENYFWEHFFECALNESDEVKPASQCEQMWVRLFNWDRCSVIQWLCNCWASPNPWLHRLHAKAAFDWSSFCKKTNYQRCFLICWITLALSADLFSEMSETTVCVDSGALGEWFVAWIPLWTFALLTFIGSTSVGDIKLVELSCGLAPPPKKWAVMWLRRETRFGKILSQLRRGHLKSLPSWKLI